MIYLATENRALFDYLHSLLSEAGFSLADDAEEASLVIWDLDSVKNVAGEAATLRISSDPFAVCELARPFSSAKLLALCRERLSGEPLPEEDKRALFETKKRKEKKEPLPAIRLLSDGVLVFGEKVALSPCELRLFTLLHENIGQAVSLAACAEAIGYDAERGNMPSVYINRLRKKFDYRFAKRMIVTLRGQGYMLLSE